MGDLADDGCNNRLYVSIGIFSVIRIERPAQYLINASDYAVPDKECTAAEEDDPCKLFRSMAFPIQEFSPPALSASAAECRQIPSSCTPCAKKEHCSH
jgi:hypothetical protein